MAISSNHDGLLVAAGTTPTLHSTAGRLLGYLVSHDQTSVQTITFYDNTAASGTVLHRIHVAPEQCPYYVRFGAPPHRREGIKFTTGLTVDPGANCDLAIWSVGF